MLAQVIDHFEELGSIDEAPSRLEGSPSCSFAKEDGDGKLSHIQWIKLGTAGSVYFPVICHVTDRSISCNFAARQKQIQQK